MNLESHRRRAAWAQAQRRAELRLERKIAKASVMAYIFTTIAFLLTGPALAIQALTDNSAVFMGLSVIASLLVAIYWTGRLLYLARRKKILTQRWQD